MFIVTRNGAAGSTGGPFNATADTLSAHVEAAELLVQEKPSATWRIRLLVWPLQWTNCSFFRLHDHR